MAKYMDIFWYSFLNDFPDADLKEAEWDKQRLKDRLEEHKKAAAERVIVEGSLYSH